MSFLIPSHRSRPADDPIFALNAEAKVRAQAGESVINATVGSLLDDEGKLATLPSVVEAIRATPAQIGAGYAPIAGSPTFLRAVADDLLGDRPERAWVASAATPGGTGALRHAVANFIEPQQTLLTTSFYWGPYKTLAEENDRGLAVFRMFDERGRFDSQALRVALEKQLRVERRALLFFNSPCHNPTGYSFDASEWREIRETVLEFSSLGPVTVCLDIAYARFGAQPLTVMLDEMLSLAPKALVLFAWSASKSFLQYGLRVGALLALHPDDEERRRIQGALTYSCRGTWSNINAGGMDAIARVLQTPALSKKADEERTHFVQLLGRRVARWNELAPQKGLKYPRYDGGFFVTVFADDAFSTAERLKSSGVFVVPQAGALRVAVCSVAERDVARLVDEIARTIA